MTAGVPAGFDEVANGLDVELGLLNGLILASIDEGAPKGEEDAFPNGFVAASGFEGAPKEFVGVLAADAAPNIVAAGFPKGFTDVSGFEEAPKGFEFEIGVFVLDGVAGLDPKGLNAAGAAEPKEGDAAGACAKGFVVVGDGGLLEGSFPLPPRPLIIVPF